MPSSPWPSTINLARQTISGSLKYQEGMIQTEAGEHRKGKKRYDIERPMKELGSQPEQIAEECQNIRLLCHKRKFT